MKRNEADIADFDFDSLFKAMDAQRVARRLSWNGVAKEMWQMYAELDRSRPNDHPLSPSTIISMSRHGNTTCQHALIFLQWLGRRPESFLPGVSMKDNRPLRPFGTDRRPRWHLRRLYDALNARRQELDMTWPELARVLGCTPSQLTGIRTARYAINMKLAMRIVQWLKRPSTDSIYLATWRCDDESEHLRRLFLLCFDWVFCARRPAREE